MKPDVRAIAKRWLARFQSFAGAPGNLFLMLALVVSLGAVVSWRYHFFFQNYSRFVVEEVLPREHALGALPMIFGNRANRSDLTSLRLDQFPFDSPYLSQTDPAFRDPISVVASDFSSMWFFLKTIEEGGNPYKRIGQACFNLGAPCSVHFSDVTVPSQMVFTGMPYFPAAPWLIWPFFKPNYLASLASYLVTFKLFLIVAGAYLLTRLRAHRGAVGVLLVAIYFGCYPVDFMVDRGNIEGLVFMLVAGFYAAYLAERPYVAALLLAGASAVKLIPALLFVHFVLDRRYRPMVFGAMSLAAFSIASLLTMHAPMLQLLSQFYDNLTGHIELTRYMPSEYRFSHSLITFLTAGLSPTSVFTRAPWVDLVGNVYPVVAFIVLGGLLWRIRGADFERRTVVLTAAMVFLPPRMTAYYLMHMLVPFVLLVLKAARSERVAPRDALLLLLVAALFLAKEYLVGMFGLEWGVGILVNPLLLIGILVLASTARREARESQVGVVSGAHPAAVI